MYINVKIVKSNFVHFGGWGGVGGVDISIFFRRKCKADINCTNLIYKQQTISKRKFSYKYEYIQKTLGDSIVDKHGITVTS